MSHLIKPIPVVAAVIQRELDSEGRVLIVRRGPGLSGAGFWEFPGGKVEEGETQEGALIREINEELGIDIAVGAKVGEIEYSYPSKVIRLIVFRALLKVDLIELREHDLFRWCKIDEIKVSELSPADRPFVQMLL